MFCFPLPVSAKFANIFLCYEKCGTNHVSVLFLNPPFMAKERSARLNISIFNAMKFKEIKQKAMEITLFKWDVYHKIGVSPYLSTIHCGNLIRIM